jgi:hypothetical protein
VVVVAVHTTPGHVFVLLRCVEADFILHHTLSIETRSMMNLMHGA